MKKVQGFTLIELMIVVALVGMLLVGVSNLFLSTIGGGNKAYFASLLKNEGDYAMVMMGRIIRQGKDINQCSPASNNLTVIGIDNEEVRFRLSGGIIERSDDMGVSWNAVTSTNINVAGSQIFNCVNTDFNDAMRSDVVEVSFTMTAGGMTPQIFRSTFVQRNSSSL